MTLDLAKGFLDRTPKVQATKKKKKKKKMWMSSKFKTFVLHRTPLRAGKDNPQSGRKYLQIIYLMKDLYPEYIKSPYNSIIKTNHPNKKWAKDLNIHLSKEDIQIANKQ